MSLFYLRHPANSNSHENEGIPARSLLFVELCQPHWGVDILFLLFPSSTVYRLSSHLVSGHFKENYLSYLSKFGMDVYWVGSLHGVAFGEDSSIAN